MLSRICIIGPAGSGKSTIAKMLADTLAMVVIDTGEILRNPDDYVGVREIIGDYDVHSGDLLDSEKLNLVVRQVIDVYDRSGDKWILVGTPRQIPQLDMLEEFVKPDGYLIFDGPRELLLDRIAGRSADDGSVRKDDAYAIACKRLDVYDALSRPVADRLISSMLTSVSPCGPHVQLFNQSRTYPIHEVVYDATRMIRSLSPNRT